MRFTPTRRLLIALLAFGIFGCFYFSWLAQLLRNISGAAGGSTVVHCSGMWRDFGYPDCYVQHPGRYWQLLIAGLLIATAAVVGLITWVLRPIRLLTESVSRMGIQNLSERNRMLPRRDEVVRLATAIDGLMDRVSDGYEGQRRFAANASHELRTPLAVQRALIEVGMSNEPTTEQLELLRRQLLDTNERSEQLMEGLLVLAETDRGLVETGPQRLDELARHVVDRHLASAQRAGVRLELRTVPRIVMGEAVLLERLIENLVQNAIKYNVRGGSVLVEVAADPAIRVSNTGGILAEESVDGLFEPFRRARGDRLNHRTGAGLGLTIVRSVAQAHGGSSQARANPTGGLTIEVRLPRQRLPHAHAKGPADRAL
ncbi:signal transduction histidine kinase [Jatrophihabitans sp. GAS493]|uniref:sensor histidine kinase n=1 Tax=Jatrophihabitans sp. GAS493 TaxID=1907575 RepID=UPI000BB8CD11|nr:HAMP domain-containing sensor histidine kinase [Jatrophihabitans sp. GAS493]SOD74445.1 signal transduction histidine kinase [Jatrophihabitans sp. GAS493]